MTLDRLSNGRRAVSATAGTGAAAQGLVEVAAGGKPVPLVARVFEG